MKDRRHLDRIPSEELTAYERWEAPLLDQQGNEVAREEELDVKPLTAGELEGIRAAAREDGHAEGHEAGYKTGLEKGRKEGHKEGMESGRREGLERGHAEALKSTRKDVDTGLDRLETVMSELLDPIRQHESEIETALLNLTTVLARAVIFRELQLDSSHIRDVVKQAMASLPSTRENVKIRVHPEDADWVREVAGRFEAAAAVVSDESVLKGGCKVETRHSLVDFTVEKRFQKAVQAILDKQLSDDHPGDHAGMNPAMMDDLTDFHDDVLSEAAPETPDSSDKVKAERPPHDQAAIKADPESAPDAASDSEDAKSAGASADSPKSQEDDDDKPAG
jgi:flagellar assembly protein FliH